MSPGRYNVAVMAEAVPIMANRTIHIGTILLASPVFWLVGEVMGFKAVT
jgi:hypothetical protein